MKIEPRALALLKTLIDQYITKGQPVGSRVLSKLSNLDLSPATIRNIMADLEKMGFVVSPHTSAGRIPTPRGFRMFADTLLTATSTGKSTSIESGLTLQSQIGQPQKTLSDAAQMLSSLTQFAGIVLAPQHESAFSQIEFLRLSEKRILLVIVTPNGDVQNRLLLTDMDYTASQLTEAANYINTNYTGLSFSEIRKKLQNELREIHSDLSELMKTAIDVGDKTLSENAQEVVIAGENNLLNVTYDISSLRQLFTMFEQKTELMRLLDISSRAKGIQIYIGGDSQLVPSPDISVVTAPYQVNGQFVGTLGVIGPTRMAYKKVIHIVDITSRLLSNALSHVTISEN